MGLLNRRSVCAVAALVAIHLALGVEARAQLISPGKLTRAHAEEEGIRNCTRCHDLGKPGASDTKCLACHEPLAARVKAGNGYHATLAGHPCAECHKEHFGKDFALVRFDSAGFAHDTVGYKLLGRHGEIGCRDCHAPELIAAAEVRRFKGDAAALDRTYLGLGSLCVSCHEADDPHRGQFQGKSCDECHGESDWKKAERFDHRQTRYALTGRHRQARCRECHRPLADSRDGVRLQFTGLTYSTCDACHRDVHRGAMGANCSGCHGTDSWHRMADRSAMERFDHSTTDFPLAGAHARVKCEACHGTSPLRNDRLRMSFAAGTENHAYPHPLAAACTSCHLDYHDGVFAKAPGGSACESCHTEEDWTPTTYGIARHNSESKFRLTGAHVPVICSACHTEERACVRVLRFHIADQTCIGCHSNDDPHAGQFGTRACTACHDSQSFKLPNYDHSQTRWPLDGAHRDVACFACHTKGKTDAGVAVVRYRPLQADCKACHREDR